jgi:hypothetical protein
MKDFPPSGRFKGPPQFKEAHCVNLTDNDILVRSCGLKDRYGIPCQHLFALEPVYAILDIDYHYQIAFAYFGYHPDHQPITQTLKEPHLLEPLGVRKRTLVSHKNLPHLGTLSPLKVFKKYLRSESKVQCWCAGITVSTNTPTTTNQTLIVREI